MDQLVGRWPALRRGASAEQRVMEAIRRHFRAWGAAPSWTEIHDLTGIRRGNIRRHLVNLETLGMLELQPGVARGIRLADRGAMLSDTELALAAAGRGYQLVAAHTVALPLTEAYPVWTDPDCDLPLDELIGQIDAADGGYDGASIGEDET